MSAPFDLDKAVAELRRPFTAAAVKVKPLTNPRDGKSAAAFYIDARLVAERLNAVVGAGAWSDDYHLVAEGRETPALFYPVVCRLTIAGVTKSDVGQGASTIMDEKAWKSAYSDALKRAAVKFGVGAYLYAIPRLYAPVDVGTNGKVRGFTKDGRSYLLTKYQGWLGSPLNTFGDPLDHGDVADDEPDEPEPPAAPQNGGKPASAAEQKKLDKLIATMAAADGSKDWAQLADKYALREFGHGREQLTKPELEQVAKAMQEHLSALDKARIQEGLVGAGS